MLAAIALAAAAMNYRHAFHAGNFADVFKHTIWIGLIESLKRKQTPFCCIDTHAGSARYQLGASEAGRTLEYTGGIAAVMQAHSLPSLLHLYLGLVRHFNPGGSLQVYPGSPLLTAALLRESDRLIACELQPEEAQRLKAEFRHDARVACHQRDGYEALSALLPPKERRGAVLIDPPFEQADEFDRAIAALRAAHERWPQGIYAFWYPIKLRADIEVQYRKLKSLPFDRMLIAELCLHPDDTALRLNGCGMLLINPPYRYDQELGQLLPLMAQLLSQSRHSRHALRVLKEPA